METGARRARGCRRRRQRRQGGAGRPRRRSGDGPGPRRDAATRRRPTRSPSTVAGLVRHFPGRGAIGCTLPAVVVNGVVRTATQHRQVVDRRARGDGDLARDRPSVRRAERRRRGRHRRGALRRGARAPRAWSSMVTIGTGVGTALLNDGVLVPNSELGHIFVEPPPRRHVGVRRDARRRRRSRGSNGPAGSTATSRSCTRSCGPSSS